jgi:hypothetical protein
MVLALSAEAVHTVRCVASSTLTIMPLSSSCGTRCRILAMGDLSRGQAKRRSSICVVTFASRGTAQAAGKLAVQQLLSKLSA